MHLSPVHGEIAIQDPVRIAAVTLKFFQEIKYQSRIVDEFLAAVAEAVTIIKSGSSAKFVGRTPFSGYVRTYALTLLEN